MNVLPLFIGGSLAVTNLDLDQQRDALERQSMSSLVWPLALSWNLYEAALAYKLQADDLVRKGDPETLLCAYSMYSHLVHLLDHAGASGIFMPSSSDALSQCFDADIHGSRLVSAFRVLYISEAVSELDALMEGMHRLPPAMIFRVLHFSGALTLLRDCIMTGMQVERTSMDVFLGVLEGLPHLDSSMEHDRALVVGAIAQNEQAGKISIDPSSLSIFALPMEPFDHHRELDLPTRPSDFVGCQYLAHLRSLIPGERERIVKSQQKHGLLVTNLE
ncbi:hypothetical protein LTR78_003048 [Recurvomyces mirabilis]|uniref:Uncharacterized protein n=1 Tax=Recurvomyces mirabilis TaxID=574656 RepID=A0AAE0WS67_9PEZI|nr:hypothetical protein LTR78_003048 [Recurvomyces mirabilis]KAK5157130.1 hypothetical protein LTS14_004648 [Recurvomyces mirabilis]